METNSPRVSSDVAEAVMGTDRFSAPARRIEELPFTDASLTANGSGVCHIDAGDDSLTVKAGGWACGSADPADLRTALKAVAEEATCYEAPARPWDPES